MSCTQVLAQIDALPLIEWPADMYEGAIRHAHGCSECQSALTAAEALDSELTRLVEPMSPPELAASVMRRVARIDDARSGAEEVDVGESARRDRLAWALGLAGLVAAVGAELYVFLTGEAPGALAFLPVVWWVGLTEMPGRSVTVFLLAMSLFFYLSGFLAISGNPSSPPSGER